MSLSQVLLLGWVVAVVVGSVFAAVVKEDRRPPKREKPRLFSSETDTAIALLTDRYVSDEIELDEFERRVERALLGKTDSGGRPEWVRLAVKADFERYAELAWQARCQGRSVSERYPRRWNT